MLNAASLRRQDKTLSFDEFIVQHRRYAAMPESIARLLPEARKAYADYLDHPLRLTHRSASPALPAWPEQTRGVPNCVLRSSLFSVLRRGRRGYQEQVEKAALDTLRILFTGPMLDQADRDVWQQCLHLARNRPTNQGLDFSVHSFLLSIGRTPGGASAAWLHASLARLCASFVEIQDGNLIYAGPLLQHVGREPRSGRWHIALNPAIGELFRDHHWTATEWAPRIMGLKGHPLAQWLHGFYLSHAKPFPYRIATLHRICGSEAAHLYHFRAELKASLNRLAAVTGWQCEMAEDDMIYVQKSANVMEKQTQCTFSQP